MTKLFAYGKFVLAAIVSVLASQAVLAVTPNYAIRVRYAFGGE